MYVTPWQGHQPCSPRINLMQVPRIKFFHIKLKAQPSMLPGRQNNTNLQKLIVPITNCKKLKASIVRSLTISSPIISYNKSNFLNASVCKLAQTKLRGDA